MKGFNPSAQEINDLAQRARAAWRRGSTAHPGETSIAGTPAPEPPTKEKTMHLSEKIITRQIRDTLKLCRVFHWKAWQGMGSTPGVADILGCYQGRLLAIEVKTDKGKLSDHQERFLERVNTEGGIGFVARSADDVVKMLHLRVGPLFGDGEHAGK